MVESDDKLPDIVKKILIKAPLHKVWEAVSTPEGMEKWWMPSTIKPKTGFKFVLHTDSFGDSQCMVLEVNPPYFLKFSWDEDWTITFSLKDADNDSTEFTLTHSGWHRGKKNRFDQLHSDIRPVMNGGWDRIIKTRLVEYVQSG